MKWIILKLIRGYQIFISPYLGYNCRFLPTCSAYGLEAISKHGILRGGRLTLKRLLRCHPIKSLGGGNGIDPVP